jgi:hypothetical protein
LKRERGREGTEIQKSRITDYGGGNGCTKYKGRTEEKEEGGAQIIRELNGQMETSNKKIQAALYISFS